jgi:hypothetical protein
MRPKYRCLGLHTPPPRFNIRCTLPQFNCARRSLGTESVTRVARKGSLLTHHHVHPHHETEGAAVALEVALACQKFDVTSGREL